MDLIRKNDSLTGYLCAIGCYTLYGMSFIFTKQATGSAGALSLLGWRFLTAFLIMSIVIRSGRLTVDYHGKDLRPLAVVALFCPVIYYIGETVGISKTTASESGVIIACIPAVTLAAAALILHKKPSIMQIAGIATAMAGVLITVLAAGASLSFSAAGYLSLLTAVLAYSLYTVFVDRISSFSVAEITYSMLIAGAAVFMAGAAAEALIHGTVRELFLLPFTNRDVLAAVLYGGIGCSILAFFLSNAAIRKIGVNRTASFTGLTTVVSILSGVVFLREPFTAWQVLGAAVILAGVYIANAHSAAK